MREYRARCPKCDLIASFPLDPERNIHNCSRCNAEFTALEVLGWMMP